MKEFAVSLTKTQHGEGKAVAAARADESRVYYSWLCSDEKSALQCISLNKPVSVGLTLFVKLGFPYKLVIII